MIWFQPPVFLTFLTGENSQEAYQNELSFGGVDFAVPLVTCQSSFYAAWVQGKSLSIGVLVDTQVSCYYIPRE